MKRDLIFVGIWCGLIVAVEVATGWELDFASYFLGVAVVMTMPGRLG